MYLRSRGVIAFQFASEPLVAREPKRHNVSAIIAVFGKQSAIPIRRARPWMTGVNYDGLMMVLGAGCRLSAEFGVH